MCSWVNLAYAMRLMSKESEHFILNHKIKILVYWTTTASFSMLSARCCIRIQNNHIDVAKYITIILRRDYYFRACA